MAGPQKLAALCGRDLIKSGFNVEILVPRLPYWYYFIILRGDLVNILRWIRLSISCLWSWFRNRGYAFQELASDLVRYKSVLRRPGRRHLANADVLIVMSIEHIVQLADDFPPERTIYYLLHPEEVALGSAEKLRAARSQFRGAVIALSPKTREAVADHVTCAAVVHAAIAPVFYQHIGVTGKPRTRDILLHYSTGSSKGGKLGISLIEAVRAARPETTVTIWTRDADPGVKGVEVVSGLTDDELCQCYLSHSFFLFPSTFEGAGMPPLEAMACGCIPILNAGVGAADTYASRENAIVLEADFASNVQGIVDLLSSPSAAMKLRANTREALSPFDPEGYGLRLLAGMFESNERNFPDKPASQARVP